MLTSICLGTNNLGTAGSFYDQVFASINMVRLVTDGSEIGYGALGGEPSVWILVPFDGQSATRGNGTQAIFRATDPAAVDEFHRIAMAHGGSDEGAPGPRDYAPGYYGAYCHHPDGNKLHVFVVVPLPS